MNSSEREAAFAVELGRALTGRHLSLTSAAPDDLPDALAGLGFDACALQRLRQDRQVAGEPWPFPTQPEVVQEVGFAVFHARLQLLRARLGLTGLVPRHRAERPLDADERRLAAERPPHWG